LGWSKDSDSASSWLMRLSSAEECVMIFTATGEPRQVAAAARIINELAMHVVFTLERPRESREGVKQQEHTRHIET
jgi:hypothetical protein